MDFPFRGVVDCLLRLWLLFRGLAEDADPSFRSPDPPFDSKLFLTDLSFLSRGFLLRLSDLDGGRSRLMSRAENMNGNFVFYVSDLKPIISLCLPWPYRSFLISTPECVFFTFKPVTYLGDRRWATPKSIIEEI